MSKTASLQKGAPTRYEAALRPTAAEFAAAIDRLAATPLLSLPLIGPEICAELAAAAQTLPYRRATPVVGEADRRVTQDFELCMDFPADSPFWGFAAALEGLTNAALELLQPRPFPGPFTFNDLIVQRYAPGCAGMSPHRDHIRYVGLIAIVVLAGDGRFWHSPDRSGEGSTEIPSPVGSLVLMRGPDLHARRDRPFHWVDGNSRERLSFGLRHDLEKA